MITLVRNWFRETGVTGIPPASQIWDSYNVFYSNLYQRKRKQHYSKKDIEGLPIPEFIEFMDEVITRRRRKKE